MRAPPHAPGRRAGEAGPVGLRPRGGSGDPGRSGELVALRAWSPQGAPPPPVLAVVGPTGVGKSALVLELASSAWPARFGGLEAISADAMAVYRGLDIGTAKPTATERAVLPYHLLDIVEPDVAFSVADYQHRVVRARNEIAAAGHAAVVVGGTGLYVRAAVDGLTLPGRFPAVAAALEAEADAAGGLASLYERLLALDPVSAGRMLPGNRRRLVRALEVTIGSGRPFSSFGPGLGTYPEVPTVLVGVDLPGELLERRVRSRLAAQLDAGWLDEVARLLARPAGLSQTAGQALGYAELAAHLRGACSLEEARAEIVRRTLALARRQRRWFRRDPRIRWVAAENPLPEVLAFLEDSPT